MKQNVQKEEDSYQKEFKLSNICQKENLDNKLEIKHSFLHSCIKITKHKCSKMKWEKAKKCRSMALD